MRVGVDMIFGRIGVGMGVMFGIGEFIGIKKNDGNYMRLGKRWWKG